MRNKFVFFTVFAVAVVLLAAVVASALDRRDRDVMGYNILKERIFKGVVANQGHINEGLMYFTLRTANNMMEVQIGPKEFVDRSDFKLKTGETVTVTGMLLVLNRQPVVLARRVSSMSATLVVRDQVGLPLWELGGPVLMDPERMIRSSEDMASILPRR